ncbi:MAG TPA: murein biosynthesis integral membrane protein MurJ [Pseudonocardiaceae bacterium]
MTDPAGEADTIVLPVATDDAATVTLQPALTEVPSLRKASGSMLVAGVFSKTTGFARNLVIAWVIGLSVTADAYNAANTLPNQVYELLVGGVLTSVMVPVLVRAHDDDADGGTVYTQRLLSMATIVLVVVTALAVLASPLLTALVVDDSTGRANPNLTTAFAYLLLPQILFYGLSALFTAVLNAKHVFGVTVWAPVLNNIVLLITFGIYPLLPGEMTLNPVRMNDAHLLVLGIGSTLGVLGQVLMLLPFLFRSGFRFKWRWGWDRRFAEFGKLALWTIGYALLAQIGVVVVTNVATANSGLAIYNNVWLLVQLPYGVIGFSLITAILPRMSRAAAQHHPEEIKNDLSLANRLCTVTMLPLSALMTVLGPSVGIALFSVGKGHADAGRLGVALAVAAFGALPYAITLIQLRVFYAMNDARTPTFVMIVMMAVKAVLSYLAPDVLSPAHVVYALTFVNSLIFVVGWLAGEIWLRAKLGRLGSRALVRTVAKSLLASLAAAGAALLIRLLMPSGAPGAWLALGVGGLVGIAVALGTLLLLKTEELQPVMHRIGRLAGRN